MDNMFSDNIRGRVIARLQGKWEMLGLRGQKLGVVSHCGIDLVSGRVEHLVLATPWQMIEIPWRRVSINAEEGRFQLLPKERETPHRQ